MMAAGRARRAVPGPVLAQVLVSLELALAPAGGASLELESILVRVLMLALASVLALVLTSGLSHVSRLARGPISPL